MATVETVAPESIEVRRASLRIVGDSILVVKAWDAKAKQMILDKQMKRGTQAKEAKNLQEAYEASLYHHPDGGYGFPTVGVKACAVRGAKSIGLVMTDMKGAFHIPGELLKVEGEPRMRVDMVRVGKGVADIRARGQFDQWAIDVPITYNARLVSLEQLVAMFDAGGYACGIGEFRPENGGSWGMFHVESQA